MSAAVVLRNYSRAEEALVVCAALQDAGFDAAIDNLNHASLEWYLVPALGGIQIRLPAAQLEPAKAHLNDMVQSAEARLLEATGETGGPVKRDYWRAWIALGIWFGLVELVGIAFIWLLSRIIPAAWLGPGEQVSALWYYSPGYVAPVSVHSSANGVLFIVLVALITWNELFNVNRAKTLRANESLDSV